MFLKLLVCGWMAAARLIELAYSKRNIEGAETNEAPLNRRLYPVMVALHTTVLAGTFLLGRSRCNWGWLTLLLLVQPLRWWVLSSLGRRWNTRGAVPETMSIETGGPYAHVRHPNYTVVAVELASLPLAFGLPRLAFAATLVNALLMVVRVRDEEALLFRLPGYEAHFGDKKRFIPGVF
jgi:methyltransferase